MTPKTDVEIRALFVKYLAHCRGRFSLDNSYCCNCPCLGDCLDAE